MATDATGAVTSPDNIPTYNTAADAPSGKGLNAIVAALQAALSTRVSVPAGIISGEVPVWNGASWDRSSVTKIAGANVTSGVPVVEATTIAGLGTAYDGKVGRLRLGASPFHFVDVIYDATYAKWVSTQQWQFSMANSPVTTSAGEGDIPSANFGHGFIHNYLDMWNAGLRPQVQLSCVINSGSGASQGRFTYRAVDFNTGDANITTNVFSDIGAGVGIVSVANYYGFSDWHTPVSLLAPTRSHVLVMGRIASDGGALVTLSFAYIKIRMVG